MDLSEVVTLTLGRVMVELAELDELGMVWGEAGLRGLGEG